MKVNTSVSPTGINELPQGARAEWSADVTVNVTLPEDVAKHATIVKALHKAAAVALAQHIRVGWNIVPGKAEDKASWAAHVAAWDSRTVTFDTLMAPATKNAIVVPENFRFVFDQLVAAGATPEQAMDKINAAMLTVLG